MEAQPSTAPPEAPKASPTQVARQAGIEAARELRTVENRRAAASLLEYLDGEREDEDQSPE